MAINIDDLSVGTVVAEMHGHDVNYGLLKGWQVQSMFTISEEAYQGFRSQFGAENRANLVVSNKYAQVVSVNCNHDGVAESVLVVYLYDFNYHIATLIPPTVD